MRAAASIFAAVMLLLCCGSCKRVPGYVIQPEEMAQLLADRHVAEAVVEYNAGPWRRDSSRIALRDAVYARHGVTQADVDTSLDWYGHNLNRYMEVYDRTIELLETRVANSDTRLRTDNSLTIAGDSVDVWPGVRFYSIGTLSPANNIRFALNADENREQGDSYTWRAKFVNNPDGSSWTIVAEYADTVVEYAHERVHGPGWHELTMQTDSTREAVRIYGMLLTQPETKAPVWIDSVSLVRNHVQPETYSRRSRQRVVRK